MLARATRVAVLVSGGGTNLQALLDARMKGVEIALVLSTKGDAYALERAKAAGIPAVALLEKGVLFEQKALSLLKSYQIEIIVLAGFLRILSADFIRQYPDRIVNVHPALLPSFGGKGFYGLRVHEAALSRGVQITGATVHLVNEIPDGGRILCQRAVPVQPGDTPETLQRRVMEQAEWVLLPKAVEALCQAWREREK